MKTVDIAAEMRAHVARLNITQAAAAEKWGITSQYVSLILTGKRPPTKKMLDDAGFEAIKEPAKIRYVRRKTA